MSKYNAHHGNPDMTGQRPELLFRDTERMARAAKLERDRRFREPRGQRERDRHERRERAREWEDSI